MPKMRSNDVLADHRTGTSGFRFADFRMPEMLRHRTLRGVDFPRNKCLYRASLVGSRAASAFGNNAASIAMTASRFAVLFYEWSRVLQLLPFLCFCQPVFRQQVIHFLFCKRSKLTAHVFQRCKLIT